MVVGAGMAGLTMAAALTAAFERVTVLDRDRLPPRAEHRAGVPQDRHVHLLLPAGADALEELFPGVLDELVADGAPTGDLDRFRLCLNGHRLARERIGRRGVMASRPFFEAHVRDRVRRDPAVTITDGWEARGLVTDAERRRVLGLWVGPAGGAGAGDATGDGVGGEQILPADLVVDCSGGGSSLPAWLAELGYPVPAVDQLRIDLRYASCRYDAAAGDDDALVIVVGPTPHGPRGGAMVRIEDGSWLVTLAGLGGERPPLAPDGFEAFAGTLVTEDLQRALARGRALEAPTAFRFPTSQRHRYERLTRFPAGLLAAGDAVCRFDPLYGQGMTVAALEAASMRRHLREAGVPSATAWFAAVAPIVDTAWDIAVSADLAVECIDGHRSLSTRTLNRYMARLHAAAAHDPVLTERFVRVTGLLDSPTALARPGTVARVLVGGRRRARRRVDAAAPRVSTGP